MATTFTSGQVASGVQARTDLGVQSKSAVYENTAAYIINDVVQMVKVPAGATVLDTILATSDLDTSTGMVVAVGDGTTADRFITGSTIGRTGGIERANQVAASTSGALTASVPYTYAAADTVDVKVTTAPTTGATSGCVALTVLYTMDVA